MSDNPYRSPLTGNRAEPRKSHGVATLLTASVGAVIVFVGAFVVLQVIGVFLLPWAYQSTMGIAVSCLVTVPLAIAAAVGSFRATLRSAKKPLA